MKIPEVIRDIPEIRPLLSDANHVDVKTIESVLPLRVFIAGMFSYMPWWMRGLYAIRWAFVRLLGMTQEGLPHNVSVHPDQVSFTAGENTTFFQVQSAKEDAFWLASASESHLTAYLGVVVDQSAPRKFHLITIVKYHKWTGPVYFNVIRPFHHIVVRQMMNAGNKKYNTPALNPN